ncbi:MAG: hypothetical protein JSV87_02215 [Candidatus Bathyarchaeota archaeon]|nr:MAG: hypothetical protein JSV87_02215 [Candidatus Bathyarchaeota archaeon]
MKQKVQIMIALKRMSVERKVEYFRNPGSQNSESVIEIVRNRIEGNGIRTVVVASTSGETGVKFAKALRGIAAVVVVSHEEMKTAFKLQIREYGGKAVDQTHLPLHVKGMDDTRKSFYTFGQGFKVAVEVILIAADRGMIDLYKDVLGVGGTGRGADTAIIARASRSVDIFVNDKDKKLEIREILAMPLNKHWW